MAPVPSPSSPPPTRHAVGSLVLALLLLLSPLGAAGATPGPATAPSAASPSLPLPPKASPAPSRPKPGPVGPGPTVEATPAPRSPAEPPTLTLSEAEALALARNHTLASSAWAAEAAGQRTGQSAASLYPTLDASVNTSHSDVFGADASSTTVVTTPGTGANVPVVVGGDRQGARDNLNATVTARQILFDFKRPHQLEQARQAEQAALAELEGVRQDVLLAVRKAWLAAYIDQSVLDIRRETVKNREGRLAQARGMYEAGSKARIDVATAEADLAQARLQEVQAQTQVQVDWVALNVAMGLARESPYRLVLEPSWDTVPELSADRLVETAMARRPELRTLEARLRGQVSSLEAIGAERLPTVSANASLGGSGTPTPLDGTWTVGVSLNWSLFDGFLDRYRAGEARATARSLAEQLEQQRITVYQEVASRIVQVRQAAAQIEAAEAALASARESYRLAAARYRVGVGNSLELADAELALAQAQTDLASAANGLRTSRAELARAVGVDDVAILPAPAPPVQPVPIPGVDAERKSS